MFRVSRGNTPTRCRIGKLQPIDRDINFTISNNDISTSNIDLNMETNTNNSDTDITDVVDRDNICVEPPSKKIKVEEIEGYGKAKPKNGKNKKKPNQPKKKKPGPSKKVKKICVTIPIKKHLKKPKKVSSKHSIRHMIGKWKTQKLKRDIFSYLR